MIVVPRFVSSLLCLAIFAGLAACDNATKPPFKDVAHNSTVFNKPKTYRLYLPDEYDGNKDRFPVIYFFHGWGGRYYKDDNAKLEYEKIKDLVNKYRVILVMWDGSITEDQPRPYNIGDHKDVTSTVQMKDYFIELMNHIDSAYRTQADKAHRGIIGFSMGGFMSYFLAGKYPDKIGAAVSMTGSPEFFVGDPNVHTLYPVRYAFKNLRDVKLRFHNSTADELTDLNTEVHKGALWEGGLQYEYWQFVGGHVVDKPGETEVFERAMRFVSNAFENPSPKPEKWSHYELYPEFDLWGYKVRTDKREPGFVYLKGVTPKGFGVSTLKWLPDGPPLDVCTIKVVTAPDYQPNLSYSIVTYTQEGKVLRSVEKSDGQGRLHFNTDQNHYEIGISKAGDGPDLIGVGYSLGKDKRFIRVGEENRISLTLLNRGGEGKGTQNLRVILSSPDSSVMIKENTVSVNRKSTEPVVTTPYFTLLCNKKAPVGGEPSAIKFEIMIQAGDTEYKDELEVPVYFDVPDFTSVTLDDGRPGKDSAVAHGKGNADGIASPGEEIMVYVEGHRVRLYTEDLFVQGDREKAVDEVLPAKWPDGFTLTSVIKIDTRCPDGHRIECLANYETKEFMPIGRRLTWGKLWITVKK